MTLSIDDDVVLRVLGQFLFEQNTPKTRARAIECVLNTVPWLAATSVTCDETNNPPDATALCVRIGERSYMIGI